jgi:hypothetical protein
VGSVHKRPIVSLVIARPLSEFDLYLQNESPGKDKEANWLPAPSGPFNVNLRIYSPRAEAINGKGTRCRS